MTSIDRRAWLVTGVLGMVVIIAGLLGYINLVDIGETASLVILGIGIVFILESAVFVYLEGLSIRDEFESFHKVLGTKIVMDEVSDDEGYILDMTAEHDKVVVDGVSKEEDADDINGN